MGTIDFFAPLTEEELKNPIVLPPEEELIALSPVPVDATEMRYQHPEYGPMRNSAADFRTSIRRGIDICVVTACE